MASNITLSASVRQNLLSLQSTAQLMSTTQNRLATGKKVNSALDNPANFFTSQSLSNRASDLSSLLDSINQAQQTLKQADTGITSLTKLVESAKSLAKQAQQSTSPVTNYAAVTETATLGAETLGTTGDGTAVTVSNATTYSFTVNFGGGATTVSMTSDASATYGEILSGLQSSFATAATAAGLTVGQDVELVSNTGGDGFKINALRADVDMTIGASATVGLTAAAYNSTSMLDNITAAAGGSVAGASIAFSVGGGSTTTLTFGTGAGQISTLADLDAAITGVSGVSRSGGTLTFTSAAGTRATNVTIAASTAALGTGLSLSAQNVNASGTGTIATASDTRTTYQNQYNDLLDQIDTLASDASYNGINLLNGDDLKVVFNEDGSSSLTIKGVFFQSSDLGLTKLNGSEFQTNSEIDDVLTNIDAALSNLRTQAAKFGSNLTTVQTRQDFTKNMVNNLQVGSDALVLADTNEEGANLLALQTRQQLSTTALSLSAQADQAVLRLF